MKKLITKFFGTGRQAIISFFIILAVILIARLFDLTVLDSKMWTQKANSLTIRGIYNPSPRGNIYDRNGKLLAGNKQIFSVKMSLGTMENKEVNAVTTKLIKLLEKNDDKYINNFPIKVKDGKYYFTYSKEITDWLKENKISTDATAEEALFALGDRMGIDSKDRYAIQSELQSKYGIYPPISVKDMKYTAEKDKKNFFDTYGIKDYNLTAKEAFQSLRKTFEIDKDVSNSQAMKIMAVRNELKTLGYKKYMPATISKDVSDKTVMQIEENAEKLKGVEIVSETKRYYPNDNLASHVLGYLGKITSSEEADYEKKGYETSSLVGKEGIEGKFESVLKGQDGTQIIQVDSKGNFVKTLKKIEPKKGKDIYLTIDANLQKVAEDALERNIKAARNGGGFSSKFGATPIEPAPRAKSGATVALDVKTGEVLAMASYPDFDPNLFTEGISSKNWEKLQSDNPRDSLAAAPLYNLATMSAVQPGSTFKPITAIAGLESGLDPNLTIRDAGVIKLGNRTFACVSWNVYKKTDGYEDMYKAIQVSCNYYFYCIATNKNWGDGGTMGESGMGMSKILDYAGQFGLGKKTGIELNETVATLPSEDKKIKGLQTSLSNVLYANAETYFNKDVYSNSKRLEKDINTIIGWMTQDGITYSEMKNDYLPQVGVKTDKYDDMIELCLYTYFNQAKWTTGDIFNISIGQGDNAYTPLQIVRYISALGNKGNLNETNIVKSIEDEGQTKKPKATKVDTTEDHIKDVLEGMHRVTTGSGSGVTAQYTTFPWQVAAKTGTAQKSGKINPASEVDYIKEHLSSFGNMSWSSVKKEMKRLMKDYPETYASEDVAVRRAVINLSKGKLTTESLDRFKPSYDEFAWTVALAPKDNPKIAVVCVIPQGVTGGNANPTVREIIGTYLTEKKIKYDDYKLVTEFN